MKQWIKKKRDQKYICAQQWEYFCVMGLIEKRYTFDTSASLKRTFMFLW